MGEPSVDFQITLARQLATCLSSLPSITSSLSQPSSNATGVIPSLVHEIWGKPWRRSRHRPRLDHGVTGDGQEAEQIFMVLTLDYLLEKGAT